MPNAVGSFFCFFLTENHCLPKATQIMREDVVPFVTAGIFSVTIVVLLGGYGLYRKFNVKKTDYEAYGAEGFNPPGTEGHEMKEREAAANGASSNGRGHSQTVVRQTAGEAQAEEAVAPAAATAAASNPFKAKAGNNPFQQQQTYGAAI